MHFDSFKSHLNAQQLLNGTHRKQSESLSLSPDPREPTALVHPFSPTALDSLAPLKVGNAEKTANKSALEQSQKVR